MPKSPVEFQLEIIENRIAAHSHHLIRGFKLIEKIAETLGLKEVQTQVQREIEFLKTLKTR